MYLRLLWLRTNQSAERSEPEMPSGAGCYWCLGCCCCRTILQTVSCVYQEDRMSAPSGDRQLSDEDYVFLDAPETEAGPETTLEAELPATEQLTSDATAVAEEEATSPALEDPSG